MPWLILGILLLAGFLLLMRWLATAEPSALARRVRIAGVAVFLMLAGAAVFTGRPALAVPLGMAALGFFMPRIRSLGAGTGDNGNFGGPRGRADGGMSMERAHEVLGLRPGATPEEIRDAHRRLMQKMHPDRGGSDYLAAQINEAKDVLLGKR